VVRLGAGIRTAVLRAARCCALIHRYRSAQPLPIVVRLLLNRVQWPVQDEWQGETRLRFKLRGLSAPPCPRCCTRLRIGCMRLPISAATRVRSGCTSSCGAARVMDVLSGLMHRWRSSGEPCTFRFVRRSGGISGELSAGDLPQPDFWGVRGCTSTSRGVIRPRGGANAVAGHWPTSQTDMTFFHSPKATPCGNSTGASYLTAL
jgi:hypothetical protein